MQQTIFNFPGKSILVSNNKTEILLDLELSIVKPQPFTTFWSQTVTNLDIMFSCCFLPVCADGRCHLFRLGGSVCLARSGNPRRTGLEVQECSIPVAGLRVFNMGESKTKRGS